MSRPAGEVNALDRQRLDDEPVLVVEAGKRRDADVDLLGQHIADHFHGIGRRAPDAQARMRARHPGDRRGHRRFRQVGTGAHRERTLLQTSEQVQLPAQIGLAPLDDRSKSGIATWRSSEAMLWESVGCAMFSACAARAKLRCWPSASA